MSFLRYSWPALVLGALVAVNGVAQAQPQIIPPVDVTAPRPAPPAQPLPNTVLPEQPPDINPPQPQDDTPERMRSFIPWDSNAVSSFGTRVGPYGQPQWTTQRFAPNVRAYVLPEGTADFEQWMEYQTTRTGKPNTRYQEELAMGLPGRFQLDVYELWDVIPDALNNERANQEGVQVELRYALADWDEIPFNPTLYMEWAQREKGFPDTYEFRLLLAEDFCDGKLLYAANVLFEHATGFGAVEGDRYNEYGFSQAVAVPVVERLLLVGTEMKMETHTVHGARGTNNLEFDIGPDVQITPTNRTFLTMSCLFGTTGPSPAVELWVVAGIQFGKRSGPTGSSFSPVSTSAAGR